LPKTDGDTSHIVIDHVELTMWIAGVSLKSAKNRRKRMAA
jgi:phenylpyruvate tautomerase PptA (4-oxalocrotonate tautomerase family)